MFGQNYRQVELPKYASIGEHTVEITSVQEKVINNYTVLDVHIIYEHSQKLEPSSFKIFDLLPNSTPEQQEAFNRKVTAFCQSFHITPNFITSGLLAMAGHKGRILVDKDKNGFLAVTKFIVPEQPVNQQCEAAF